MSQVFKKYVRFQTALASIKLIQASAVLDLTADDFDFLTSNKVWIATDRSRARRCVEACVYGTLDFVGYPRFPAPVEFIAAVIAYYVHPVFFSSRRRHTGFDCDWSSDVCSSDLRAPARGPRGPDARRSAGALDLVPGVNRILILDYGSQFTQLIARRVREAHVYCEIHPAARGTDLAFVREFQPKGIILSGGPSSVFDAGAPTADPKLLELGVPVLGICYGMQLVAHLAGGQVKPSREREYGRAEVTVREAGGGLFAGFEPQACITVWASHGDRIEQPPPHFRVTASSGNAPVAGFQHEAQPIYGLLFHPEVAHTPRGGEILHNFLFAICGCTPDWTPGHFIEHEVERIRSLVGPTQRAICGLSGGVDSAVAAALVHRAIGDRLSCIFVDHGLLRLHEREQVETAFRPPVGIDLRVVDAATRFLGELAGVDDPEEKRRRIGHTFIDVFEDAARHVPGNVGFLVQGTLYPDVIESASPRGGPSVTIKTHHNVGGLRPDLPWQLIEPLRELFKDEVRQEIGRAH